MTVIIDLSAAEEAQLSAAAKQTRFSPAEIVKRLIEQHLPPVPLDEENALDAKLRAWQAQDGTALRPDVSTQEMFAKWAEEDAHMTEAEREAEDLLWEDIEKALTRTNDVCEAEAA